MPTAPDGSVVDRFADLFEGNHTALGLEEGGCQRLQNPYPEVVKARIEGHLRGTEQPIGVYPMTLHSMGDVSEWFVRWGCVDFDEGEEESWVHAKNVHLALQTFGITGWIERSRSKGYHVWVFATGWVPAKLMRRALLAACQLVEAPTREINPKQEELRKLPNGEWQLGNYVRLPYPRHLDEDYLLQTHVNMRRFMLMPDGGGWYPLPAFVDEAYANRTDVAALSALASHYAPPESQVIYRDWTNSNLRGAAIDRLAGKALVIFTQGPLEGSDRSDTLWKLARYLKEDNRHTIDEALELLRDADRRWGKFHARPDGEQRLSELIQRAWF